ncbi:MAG: hypothetical protein M1822_003408 [Bathelium mastoideum]|nr:MAG: hypothetical protein M1822_003408 [Bathelium mastoideum]
MSISPLLNLSAFLGLDTDATSSNCGGRLIFLRGYPSPEWISALGYHYNIHPEYWKRHLDFLSYGQGSPQVSYNLPSTVGRIFQLSVGSIGSLGRWWRPGQRIKDLRRSAASDMDRYLRSLSTTRGWEPTNSIVRRYILHDKEHYSIEQQVTIYLHTNTDEKDWIGKALIKPLQDLVNNIGAVFVYLDCGVDLAASPPGPWSSGHDGPTSVRILPIPTDTSDKVLTSGDWREVGGHADQQQASEAQVHQSLTHLHVEYGKSLDPEARARDPFYLMNDLFRQYALLEEQTLDVIANKIEKHRIGTEVGRIETTGYDIAHSQLLHFQGFLENRIQHLEDALRFIRKRGGASWNPLRQEPCPNYTRTESAAALLTEDFEYLLKCALDLLSKIERSSSLTMNLTNIDETKRNTGLNAVLFRFTVVASFYIPLSFTASFFGMNFIEFGTGSLSIWTFFALSVPIMALSILSLFYRYPGAAKLMHLQDWARSRGNE